MKDPNTIFQNALLAQAVYSDFELDNGESTYSKEVLEDAIKAAKKGEFSAKQAETFAGPVGYALVSFTSDDTTGFDAAIFESRAEPGKYTLSIRGTAGLLDIVGADILGLGIQGRAAAQTISLFRYYKRLVTPLGAAVEYSPAEIEKLVTITNGKYSGYSITLLRNSRDFQATAAGLALQLKNDTGLGRLDPNAKIDVTGHSLGGHLAQLFGSLLFPDRVDHVFTYNGAGLRGASYKAGGAVLAALGIDSDTRFTNIVAEAGFTFAAGIGYRFGTVNQLAIERGVLTDNHSITNTTDALAIYALLGQVSPDLSLDGFNRILRAASNEPKRSYETVLDVLRQIFLGAGTESTQISFRDDLSGRDALYRNIDQLKNSERFGAFVPPNGRPFSVATLVGAFDPAGLAQDDTDGIAYRYALKQLNPFAVVGADYAQFNSDGGLDLYDPVSGRGTLTAEWLRDRAGFLYWKNQKNIRDIADGVPIRRTDGAVSSTLYTDNALTDSQAQSYSILVAGRTTLRQSDPIRISFASGQGDTLQGGSDGDRLYGGSGNDTLLGGGGGDYLEGGAGADTLRGDAGDDILIGGVGADTLLGGAGNDTLDGGKDDDILEGGAGDDIYLIRAGDGRDTITDRDGRNTIIYVDATGKRSVVGVPVFAVAGQSNTWTGYLASGESVAFTRNSPLTATFADGTQIVFDDYQDGDYGVQLRAVPQYEPTPRIILGDVEGAHFDSIFDETGKEIHWTRRKDQFGIEITDPARPIPNNPDLLGGTDGDDYIAGFGGDDQLWGGEGADHIVGGAGVDRLYGMDGDDIIEGQDHSSLDEYVSYIDGGAGNDVIYAIVKCDIANAIGSANYAGLEVPGSRLFGGAGDDIIVGSLGADIVAGGAGGDVLIGGGGADRIYGDANLTTQWEPTYRQYFGTDADDADLIYGGSGDDEIYAGPGDDYVEGGDGDDLIYGESGCDTIFGGAGDDYIYAGADNIDSEASNDFIDGGDGNDFIWGNAGDNILLGGSGDDVIDGGGGGDDYIEGNDGNDLLHGTELHGGAGDDVLSGTPGADRLYGDDGNDTLSGENFILDTPDAMAIGTNADGEDWLFGGAGDDTYVFMLGGRTSHVVDDVGFNLLYLLSYEVAQRHPAVSSVDAPISRDSVHLNFHDSAYWLVYGDRGDSIELGAAVSGSNLGINLIHYRAGVQFDEDLDPGHLDPVPASEVTFETISWSDLTVTLSSSPDGGMLIAIEEVNNTLTGNSGSDILVGASRDDILAGGTGDDFLDGGDGADSYLFHLGDGVDIVSDSGTQGADTLVFGVGIAVGSLTLGVSDALLIRVGESGDAVLVDGFDPNDAGTAGTVERFEFADGTALSYAQLVDRGFDLFGGDGDDIVYGTNLVDRFHESPGNDILVGGPGNDAYYFSRGAGHDLVVDFDITPDNSDTLLLGANIAPDEVIVRRDAELLTLALVGTGDLLDIQWRPDDGYALERVQFADGTFWDRTMLESRVIPVQQDMGDPTPPIGNVSPPVDSGSNSGGAGDSAGSGSTQDGSGTPSADAGPANPETEIPNSGDTTQAAPDGDAAAGAPANPGTGASNGGDTSLAELGRGARTDDKRKDPGTDSPIGDGAAQVVDIPAPPAVAGSGESGMETQIGNETTQIEPDSTAAIAEQTPDTNSISSLVDDGTVVAIGGSPADDAAISDIGTEFSADGSVPSDTATDSPVVADTTQTAGNDAAIGNDALSSQSAGVPAADAPAPSGGMDALVGVEETLEGRAGVTDDAGVTVAADGDDQPEHDLKSDDAHSLPIAEDGATASQRSLAVEIQSQLDAVTDAIFLSNAFASETAPMSPRRDAKFTELSGGLSASEQAVTVPRLGSLFDALRPAPPNTQSWLDSWLGPRARFRVSASEQTSTPSADQGTGSSEQDMAPPNLPRDEPGAKPSEELTPGEIAHSYEIIEAWFEDNYGLGQNLAAEERSLLERNPFATIQTRAAGSNAAFSAAWFGQTPGMATIGGQSLQSLRGINEGYLPLGVI